MVVIEAQLGLQWDQFALGAPCFLLSALGKRSAQQCHGNRQLPEVTGKNTSVALPQLGRTALAEGETEAQSNASIPSELTQLLAGATIQHWGAAGFVSISVGTTLLVLPWLLGCLRFAAVGISLIPPRFGVSPFLSRAKGVLLAAGNVLEQPNSVLPSLGEQQSQAVHVNPLPLCVAAVTKSLKS